MKVYIALLVVLLSGVASAVGTTEFEIPFVIATGKSVEEHRLRTYSYVDSGVTRDSRVSYTVCREILENPTMLKLKIDLKDNGKGHWVDENSHVTHSKSGVSTDFVVSADYNTTTQEFVVNLSIRQGKDVLDAVEMQYDHLPPPAALKIPSKVGLAAVIETDATRCSATRLVIGSSLP